MTKNNLIPKENIPKIVEIREIENQIPTYEEFLKSCESEQLNYTDLTHEDINSSKGYGPCSWNNPNCSCYASQGYTPLKMAYTTASNWYHSSGGYLNASDQPSCGTLLISGQGHIKCANCGTAGDWKQWRFKSSGQYSYNHLASSSEFLNALQMATGMYSDSNSRSIIMSLVNYLMRNY